MKLPRLSTKAQGKALSTAEGPRRALRPLLSTTVLIVIAAFFAVFAAAEEDNLDGLIKDCGIVFEEVVQMPEGIPLNLLKNASAIAIFPSTIKGAFFLGGSHGGGVVIHKDPETGLWSPPAFFNVTGLSFGWQIGGQATDLILVMPSERGFEAVLKNQINVGGNAALAAGPIGRDAQMNTDIMLKGGIFTYSRSKGLFAGISLKGASIYPDKAANMRYYADDVTARDILVNNKVTPSEQAKKLIETVEKYTK